MGILSKIRARRSEELKEEKKVEEKKEEAKEEELPDVKVISGKKRRKKSKSEVDIERSLASYIVATEVLMAIYFDEKAEFPKIYDAFRKEWKVEELINKVAKYDSLFKSMYWEVNKWLKGQ